MGDRLSAHIRTLQTVKWDVPKEGGGVNDYMELLVKETVTLHKVLSRYLALSVVEVRFSSVTYRETYSSGALFFFLVCHDAGLCGNKSSVIGGVRQHRTALLRSQREVKALLHRVFMLPEICFADYWRMQSTFTKSSPP